mmetsp:Transcript_18090/g.51445  ORF Transcript_18090/g.51445 Transcript_18090/m.51445 type:complete len:126 (+) Transcript_18090:1887-2264(+)
MMHRCGRFGPKKQLRKHLKKSNNNNNNIINSKRRWLSSSLRVLLAFRSEPDQRKPFTTESIRPMPELPPIELNGTVTDIVHLAFDKKLSAIVIAKTDDHGKTLPCPFPAVNVRRELRIAIHSTVR